MASLVAHGFGVSMMPGLVRLPAGLPVVRVPLRDAPHRRLLTCVRRGSGGQRPVAAGLAALARAAVQATATRCAPA